MPEAAFSTYLCATSNKVCVKSKLKMISGLGAVRSSFVCLVCVSDSCGKEWEFMQSNNKTWHSCFQCHYSHVDSSACNSLNDRDRQLLEQCNQHFGFGMLSVSNYAAQLAWWLNFFTPDRFLIISSQELRDEESSMKVLPQTSLYM